MAFSGVSLCTGPLCTWGQWPSWLCTEAFVYMAILKEVDVASSAAEKNTGVTE